MRRVIVSLGFVCVILLFVPALVFAQASISGIVQDPSGAVLPGVTVEFDNLFNMRNVVAVTENYGSNWLRPASVQRGRNIRFGIQYRF